MNASGGHVRGRHADGPWEIRKAVRELASAGCTMIKTAATGGFQWEHERVHWPDYTEEELIALVDECRMRDMPVAAHAHGHEGLKYAVNAKVHMVHHGALIDDEGLEAITKADLYFVPTLFTTSIGRVAKVESPWTKELIEACRVDLGDKVNGIEGNDVRRAGRVDNPDTLTHYDPEHPYLYAEYDKAERG